jgi:Tol biopolymer transport system component
MNTKRIDIQILMMSFLLGIFGCGTKPRLNTIFYFDLSPTQDRILIFGNYNKEKWGLFVSNLTKGKYRLLRQIDYCTSSPTWSPDGEYIIYDSPNGLCKITMDGRVTQVTNITEREVMWDSFPKWSPRGDKIAFVRCFKERGEEIKEFIPTAGYTDLWKIDLEKEKEECLVKNFWWHWEWSIDGKNIFFLRTLRKDPRMDLWSINVNTKEQKRLTRDFRIWYFNISPDKEKMLFLSSKEPRRLGIMSIDGTELRELPFDGNIISANWSPDGKKIAFLRRTSKGNEICLIEPPYTQEKQVAFGNIPVFKWFSNGKQILYLKDYNTLWITNTEGTNQRQIFP